MIAQYRFITISHTRTVETLVLSEAFSQFKIRRNAFAAEVPPRTPLGS